MFPILDLEALKAKAFVSPLAFERQLKIVVLPTFVIPIIPHWRAMSFQIKVECKVILFSFYNP
jgi:hypothetical protein